MKEKIKNMPLRYVTNKEAYEIRKAWLFIPFYDLTYLYNEDLLIEGEIGILNGERIIEKNE
ncbi:MAG: hypothetical protein ACOC1O_05890 [bacterium]